MKAIDAQRGAKQFFLSLLATVVMQGPLHSADDADTVLLSSRIAGAPTTRISLSEAFPWLDAGKTWRLGPAMMGDHEAGPRPMAARLASWAAVRSVKAASSSLEFSTDARRFLRRYSPEQGQQPERINVNLSGQRGLRLLCQDDEAGPFNTGFSTFSVRDLDACAVPLGAPPAPYPMPLWWTDGLIGDWSPAWNRALMIDLYLRR
jgi:hypothetical protein